MSTEPEVPVEEVQSTLAEDVFELFPYGIMVCDASGRIVAANRRVREIIDPRASHAFAATCCSLLGCHRPGGPIEKCCLTELALQAERRLPEIRLDVPSAPSGALWATAAPLGDDGSLVIYELRPGSPHDRRARTRPHWLDRPRLRIFALGRLRLEAEGRPLSGDWLDQRPGQLLRFLICERQRIVPTDVIAEAIWRNPGAGSANTVRHFVHALRERLEPGRRRQAESSFIVRRHGGYALHGERVWVDVDEFEQGVRRGTAAAAAGDADVARERFERAMDLYSGDFLADEPYAEWALSERERLRAVAAAALRTLAGLHDHDPTAAARYLERLATMEPFDNDVQRDLILAWLRLGRRSRAVRHYQAFRLRLLREFDDRPGFELSELVAAVDRA